MLCDLRLARTVDYKPTLFRCAIVLLLFCSMVAISSCGGSGNSNSNNTGTSGTGTGTSALTAQTINFTALANVTYGAQPITLTATASSGLAVSYAVAGPATINGTTLTVTGAGAVTVTASQAGNSTYAAATPVARTFTVAAAMLTVSANNETSTFGQALPALTYTITGFVDGDTQAVVSGTASVATTATSTSSAGTYPITVTAGTLAAVNYTFTFMDGTLTVDVVPASSASGNWNWVLTSASQQNSTQVVAANLQQADTAITGFIEVTNSTYLTTSAIPVTGTYTPNGMLSLTGTQNSENVSISGTVSSANLLSGQYSVTGSPTADSGTVVGFQPASAGSTWTGTFTSLDSTGDTIDVTAQLTETATNNSADFSLSGPGTITGLGVCGPTGTTSFTFQGQQDGSSVTLTATEGGQNWLQLSGAVSPDGSTMSGSYVLTNTSSPCTSSALGQAVGIGSLANSQGATNSSPIVNLGGGSWTLNLTTIYPPCGEAITPTGATGCAFSMPGFYHVYFDGQLESYGACPSAPDNPPPYGSASCALYPPTVPPNVGSVTIVVSTLDPSSSCEVEGLVEGCDWTIPSVACVANGPSTGLVSQPPSPTATCTFSGVFFEVSPGSVLDWNVSFDCPASIAIDGFSSSGIFCEYNGNPTSIP